MKNLVVMLTAVMLLTIVAWYHWGEGFAKLHWRAQWVALFTISAIGLGVWAARRVHPIFGSYLSYALLSCIYLFAYRYNFFLGNSEEVRVIFQRGGALSLASILLTVTPILLLSAQWRSSILQAFALFTLIESVVVILQTITHHVDFIPNYTLSPSGVGLIGYAGMSGCLIAVCYPILLKVFSNAIPPKNKYLWVILLIPVIAIVLCSASVPFGVFGLGVGGYLLCRLTNLVGIKRALISVGAFIAVVGVIGVFTQGESLFHSARRFEAYRVFMGWWWEYGDIWIGLGQGSFYTMGPFIQRLTDFNLGAQSNWIWMHSDWLQLIFEQGFIGFGLVVILFGVTLKAAWRCPFLFGSVLAYGGMALFNFPVHYALHGAFGVLLVVHVLSRETLYG